MAVKLSISITPNSQNIANNTTNVTVALSVSWTYGSWNATTGPHGYLTIDGTKYTFEKKPFNSNHTTTGSQTIFTKTVNVTHNSDGTKNLVCSGYYWVDLDSASSVTASASKALTTIPRKSSLSASNGTLGTAQTLTVTKQASAFTHTITYKCGSATGTVCTKSSDTSISWTPPASLASQNTTGKSVSVTFTITTFSGSTNIGSNTESITCSIPSTDAFCPKCSVSIEESTNYSATYGAPIKGLSKLKVTITPTLAYGSAISSYSATINGTKYSSASFTTDFLTSSGTITASVTVKDKRGNSGTGSASITGVLDYDPPAIDRFTVHRCDADGTTNDKGDHVKVVISYHVSALNNNNSCQSYIQYKKTSEADYYDPVDLQQDDIFAVTNHEVIFAADTGSSYDVLLSVADDLRTTTTATSASTAFTLMHWNADGTGMGIGKISEESNLFDIDLASRFNGPVCGNVMGLNKLPEIPANSDFNNYMDTGSWAVYRNDTASTIANIPIASAGRLEVSSATGEGIRETQWSYLRQKYIPYDTRYPVYERNITRSADNIWVYADWVRTSLIDTKILWSGTYYMTEGHTVTLSESVLDQNAGIVLVFSKYDGSAAVDNNFNHFFVPKAFVKAMPGYGSAFTMMDINFGQICHKYLYINPTTISGHENNDATGTGASGITYNNAAYVLRYVIGV